MAFVSAMVSGCSRLNLDASSQLAEAQIEPFVTHDGQERITASQMEKLSDRLMRDLDDECLGWFRRRLPWGSYGMLARASITAPNLRIAMQRWCRHHALLTEDIQLVLHEPVNPLDSPATVTLVEANTGSWLHGSMREFCHVSLLRNLLGLSSWLVDSRIPLINVDLAFSPPTHVDCYPVLFNGHCRFGQASTRMTFDRRYLDLPLRRDESALRQMLQRALPLTVHTYRKDRLLVSRVRQILLYQPNTLRNAQLLAEALHLSVRTLHRQLREEGANLQALKDDVRRERAMDLLLRTTQPIKKIALAVGFDNDKSFLRAFRTWTGKTPSEVRVQPSDQ